MELSAQIDAKRGGGQSWFDLKRQISVLANALHTIPARVTACRVGCA